MLIAALEKERLAVQRMKDLDEAKNEFVSTVSHELRTPVTSIVGYTEMLEDGSLVDPAPEQRPLLQSIARNGQRLILLCDDLLTLSGIDSGAARWERNAVDLSAILVGAEDALRAQLAGRDLDVVVMSTDAPIPVLGDRVQLERALTNLLSNAIKFTEDGGRIEVSAKVHEGEAWLTVSDTGIGIPVDGAGRPLPALLPLLLGSGARDPGHRAGAVDRGRDRGHPRWADRRTIRPPGGHHVHDQVAAGARLTALMTALSEAVTMLGSTPTPQQDLVADRALDVRRRDGVATGRQRVLGVVEHPHVDVDGARRGRRRTPRSGRCPRPASAARSPST